MSAIAGYVDHRGPSCPISACHQILDTLSPLGGDGKDVRCLGNAAFGRDLRTVVPEDEFDGQPLVGAGGRCLLVADARIDNRQEIIARLGLDRFAGARMSDSALLLAAWERYGLACVDHLLGDFVFAVWEQEERRLTLARSPLGSRPLFYAPGDEFVAFATLPHALSWLVPAKLNRAEAAAIAGGEPFQSDDTLFEGISRVHSGHAVVFTPNGRSVRRIWDLDSVGSPPPSLAEAGEALRAELDRAVTAQLRRTGGKVAAQLSSGRDSSAVVGTAARLLAAKHEPLLALTAAPRVGFRDGNETDWLSDESPIAAETAARYSNIIHRICRSRPAPVKDLFDQIHQNHFGPMLNASNAEWYLHTLEAASQEGATVLLTGGMGNFSISRGGVNAVSDVLREDGLRAWWQLSRSLKRSGQAEWRTLANMTIGPWLPRIVHHALLRGAGRQDGVAFQLPLLRRPFRTTAEQVGVGNMRDRRPSPSLRIRARDYLYGAENADLVGIATWGVDVRDPTADRRLVELCHSFAARHLTACDPPRPVYAAAFSDRVSPEVSAGRRRGFQAADWLEVYRPDEIRAALVSYSANPVVAELFDFERSQQILDDWPSEGGYKAQAIREYGQRFLNSVSLAGFIALRFPG